MGNQGHHVPGNALATAANVQRMLIKIGSVLADAENAFESLYEDGVEVVGLSVKFPTVEYGEYLITIRAQTEGGKKVGFHSESGFAECVVGSINRLRNRSIVWKEDTYANR